MRHALFTFLFTTSAAFAAEVDVFDPTDFTGADIVIVGEIHDDPSHHVTQADIVAMLDPTAVVFEMLTAEQAALITPHNVAAPTLGVILGWEETGWPDFAIYAPIFAAAGDAVIVGAAPSADDVAAARDDSIAAFGDDAALFGLSVALPDAEQHAREQGMQDGHCGALPPEMLPWFVDQQRFRDAVFAREALQAVKDLGGPVVVITGNGHARNDWGMPVYLDAAAPDRRVISVGQITETQDMPPFDIWRVGPAVERPDPCAAFQ